MTEIPKKQIGDFCLPAIGLGTWQMGGRETRDPANDDAKDVAAIRAALTLGFTHIDTAEQYAEGAAEQIVGEAIKDSDKTKLYITTKVHLEHLTYDDAIRSAKASIARLGIKQIYLYLIHKQSPAVPVAETLRAMAYLVDQGLVKFIGVSNFDVPRLEEALSASKYPIVNNQIHYSLSARAYEDNGTIDFCKKHRILVTAYRPLLERKDLTLAHHAILADLAHKYQKTWAQIAINWAINKPDVVSIVKSSNPDHLAEDLGALDFQLESEDEKFLNENFPRGQTLFQTP